MALVELTARDRESTGKGMAHRLRAEGYLPGVVYGPSEDNVLVAIERGSLERLLHQAEQGTVLIDLMLPDRKHMVVIKEVQRDPRTSIPIHVDFLHISMDRPITIEVPVHLTGVADGVKNEGGMLDHVLREIEVECLPSHVPESIEMDVSGLRVGDSLHAGDLEIANVRIVTPQDRVIAAVHGRQAAEEPGAEEAEETPADAAAAEAAEGDKTSAS